MQRSKLYTLITGLAAILLSIGLFIYSLVTGWQGKADTAIVFLTLAATFAILLFLSPETWRWKHWLYVPICLFLAMGLVFLMTAITGDDGAWAYAWMFCTAGLAAGIGLAVHFSGVWTFLFRWMTWAAAGSLGLFAFFGAVVGGDFMRGFALLLLALGGVLLILRARRPHLTADEAQSAAAQMAPASAPALNGEKLVEPLTGRELEVLSLIDQGLTNQQIAERMVVAASTVKTHINNIYTKMDVQTRTQAVRRGRELGLI